MMTSRTKLALGAVAGLCAAVPAAGATTISTGAYGVFSDVRVLNTVGVTVGPVAAVSGTTAPGYNIDGSVAAVASTVDLGILSLVSAGLQIGTGVILSNASANGTTPLDTSSGSSLVVVDDLAVSLFTRLLGITTTTLGLGADTITSQTQVVRIGEINTLTGQSILSNLNLTVLGIPTLSLGANAQVGPNFVAYDLLGLTVVLNEQIATTSGNTQSLVTNAIRIGFNDFLLGGRTLTGNLIIGQSRASITAMPTIAVPEPGVWLQMIAGFGLTGLLVRRRHRLRPAAA